MHHTNAPLLLFFARHDGTGVERTSGVWARGRGTGTVGATPERGRAVAHCQTARSIVGQEEEEEREEEEEEEEEGTD